MKKYEFTEETRKVYGTAGIVTLHRIRAINTFGRVVVGMLGGWIEKEENLSHNGNAWVFDDSFVYDDAEVRDNAEIHNHATVNNNAVVSGNAYVGGHAHICGSACLYGEGRIVIVGNAYIGDNAHIHGNVSISDNVYIDSNARIYGNVRIRGAAYIRSNACITSIDHVLVIGLVGSRNDFITFYRDSDNEIAVACGCFLGKIDNFLKKVLETHGDSKHAQVYRAAAELAKLQIDLGENDEIN